jgi:allantoinase
MTEVDLVIRASRVFVDGAFIPAAVAVADGEIVAIAPANAPFTSAHEEELAEDEVLIPGVVDTHVHINEPGRTEWEGFASATRAAAAGGVTTLIDMPLNSIPPTVDVPALELKRAVAAPQSAVDVGFWGGAIPSSLGHLRALHDAGVFGFKCFLSPSGVDEFPALDAQQLLAAMTEIAEFDGLLIVHAEDPARLLPHHGGRDYQGFLDSRPDASEVSAIAAVIDAARQTGGRAHILHLSSAAALPELRQAQAAGLRITAETCPHYLTLDANHIPDGATSFKCCPPIRDSANQDLLWEALLDGTIGHIASDHSPATAELKGGGDFALAWGGIAGVQVSLAAVWTQARERGLALEHVLPWLTSAPAAWAGLPSKGRIAVGHDADLVAFAPSEAWTVHAELLEHRNPVSAYDHAPLTGRARRTWLRGEAWTADTRGRLLTRP